MNTKSNVSFSDLAICKSWLEYRYHAIYFNLPKSELMDLMKFRIRIAPAMIGLGNQPAKKRGWIYSPPSPVIKGVANAMQIRPISETRYDNIGHLPDFTKAKFHDRCQREGCKSRSRLEFASIKEHIQSLLIIFEEHSANHKQPFDEIMHDVDSNAHEMNVQLFAPHIESWRIYHANYFQDLHEN